VNLLNLAPDEKILDCVPVRDFNLPGHFMTMATKKGLVKKTPLEAYSRPKKGGIIAIKLKDGDELVDVVITKPNDQLVLATAGGMAIRFMEQDVRPTGRNTSGVRGVRLKKDDVLVGMVVADPTATLLTVCANGYGKRTNFGPGDEIQPLPETPATGDEEADEIADAPEPEVEVEEESDDASSSGRYRTQRRGGKGVIDIKTTKRNGPVVGITRVEDSDELIMMTVRGKIQRVLASDISIIGRNTQGVRIMSLDESDALMALVRVPSEDVPEVDIVAAPSSVNLPAPPASPEVENDEDANPSDDANGQTE
jgi:DNA gyrase subunit A